MKPPFRRIWIVSVDHSVVGVRATKREATETAELMREQSITGVLFVVFGPYVFSGRGR